jgi:hypothetical protein
MTKQREWISSYSASTLAQRFIFILCSRDRNNQARAIPHEFHLYPGARDWEYFAEHLPASFEFQSQAFGLTSPAK